MNCPRCGKHLLLAEGIGFFCPNKKCNETSPAELKRLKDKLVIQQMTDAIDHAYKYFGRRKKQVTDTLRKYIS